MSQSSELSRFSFFSFSPCAFQLRLGERLLHDSAPQGPRTARQRPCWNERERAFASARAGRRGAGDERHQPSLPDPETGTVSLA